MTIDPAPDSPTREIKKRPRNRVRPQFGEALLAHRLRKKLTQGECAKKAGISTQMMSAYETGTRRPSIKKAHELAIRLEMRADMAVLLVVNDELRAESIPVELKLAR